MPLLQSVSFSLALSSSKLPDFPNQKGFSTHKGITPTNWQRKWEIPKSPLPSLHGLGHMTTCCTSLLEPWGDCSPGPYSQAQQHFPRLSTAPAWLDPGGCQPQCHASPEPGSPCMISGQWPDHLFFLLSSPWALVVLFGQRFILRLARQEANFLQAFPTAVNLCGH